MIRLTANPLPTTWAVLTNSKMPNKKCQHVPGDPCIWSTTDRIINKLDTTLHENQQRAELELEKLKDKLQLTK